LPNRAIGYCCLRQPCLFPLSASFTRLDNRLNSKSQSPHTVPPHVPLERQEHQASGSAHRRVRRRRHGHRRNVCNHTIQRARGCTAKVSIDAPEMSPLTTSRPAPGAGAAGLVLSTLRGVSMLKPCLASLAVLAYPKRARSHHNGGSPHGWSFRRGGWSCRSDPLPLISTAPQMHRDGYAAAGIYLRSQPPTFHISVGRNGGGKRAAPPHSSLLVWTRLVRHRP